MENNRVCRTCLQVFSTDMVTSLDQLDESDQIAFRQKLEVCVPQVSVDIVYDPVICETCRTSVTLAYQFNTLCKDNEKILYTYVRQRKHNSYDLLTTFDLLQITHKSISNEHSYSITPKFSASSSETGQSKTAIKLQLEIAADKTPPRLPVRTKAECKQMKTPEKHLGPVEDDVLQIKRSLQALDHSSATEANNPDLNCSHLVEHEKLEELPIKKQLNIAEAPPQPVYKAMEEMMEIIHEGTNNVLKEDKNNQPKERTCRRRVKRAPKKIPLHQRNELRTKSLEVISYAEKSADKLNNRFKEPINGRVSNNKNLQEEIKNELVLKDELSVTNGTIMNGATAKLLESKKCDSEVIFQNQLKQKMMKTKTKLIKRDESKNEVQTKTVKDEVVKSLKTKRTVKNNAVEPSSEENNSESKSKYKCTKCDKVYDYRCHFDVHLRSHTIKKLFSCPTCGKDFSQETYLKAHSAIHKGSSYFKCRICKKRLSAATALKRHYRTHTGEKPFRCTSCQKQFTQKVQLEVHMRTHTGQKPYSCDVCQAAFKQKIHLLGHMRIHTGERPFRCDRCPKTFSRTQALQIHLRSHSLKPYQCKACNFLFKDGEVFRKHVSKHLISYTKTGSYSLKPHKYLGKLNEIEQDVVDINMAIYLSDQIRNEMFQNEGAEGNSKMPKFFCNICHRKLANKYSMSRHVKIHQKQNDSKKECEHTLADD